MTKKLIFAALLAIGLCSACTPQEAAKALSGEVPTAFTGEVTITPMPHTEGYDRGMMAACIRSKGKLAFMHGECDQYKPAR